MTLIKVYLVIILQINYHVLSIIKVYSLTHKIPLDKKAPMIVEYFKAYKNNDWEQYAFWDDFRYTRNLIEEIGAC